MEQPRRIPNNTDNTDGQHVDRVYSEITELYIAERMPEGQQDIFARIDHKLELIKKYYRDIHSCYPDGDKRVIEAERLHREFLGLELEDVVSLPEIIDERNQHMLTIDSSEKTMRVVPDFALTTTMKQLDDAVQLKLLLRLGKIASQMANLLSSEVDLHKDYTEKGETAGKVKARYNV